MLRVTPHPHLPRQPPSHGARLANMGLSPWKAEHCLPALVWVLLATELKVDMAAEVLTFVRTPSFGEFQRRKGKRGFQRKWRLSYFM